jgi:dihydrofolate reductase
MGSGTYKTDPVKPDSKHLFIVMTKQKDNYKEDEKPGHLEFTDESPSSLVKRFEKDGEEKILIVGGPHIATAYLKEQLIEELWLTFEPRIFGIGASFVTGEKLDIALKLLSCTTANSQGTLIIKYMVIRDSEHKNT